MSHQIRGALLGGASWLYEKMYRPHARTAIVGTVVLVLSLFYFLTTTYPHPQKTTPDLSQWNSSNWHSHHDPLTSPPMASDNQIDDLMRASDESFARFSVAQTHTLEEAAEMYRKRRGRHPPPGFDKWYKYAADSGAVIVEEFWDQIYHDLGPFWAVSPKHLRAQSRGFGWCIEIKDGTVMGHPDFFWHDIWTDMINKFAKDLPNMCMSVNPMDESRLLVRWTDINEYMKTANKEITMPKPEHTVREVKGWNSMDQEPDPVKLPKDWERWNGYNPWAYARRACPPDSPAGMVVGAVSPDDLLSYHHDVSPPIDVRHYFNGGFVANYTESSDYCSDPSLSSLHGALMMPISISNSDVLMPIFGGSKFHHNNEILLPAAMVWKEGNQYSGTGASIPWEKKSDTVIWRGSATGGRTKPYNWFMFHRHRFVAMVNGTRAEAAMKTGHDPVFNELLRESAIKPLHPETQQNLAEWIGAIHHDDVAFTDLYCDEVEPDGRCWYLDSSFNKAEPIPFDKMLGSKYLPDIDGNSFSGRYRAFLLSNSLPIKASIYREWHDARLIAWKHFVPMNSRYSDYYRLLEYFIGNPERGIPGHDDQAKLIAGEGRKWAEKVLRRVDMEIYTFRLLLEYGRVMEDNRRDVGWVDDLLPHGEKPPSG